MADASKPHIRLHYVAAGDYPPLWWGEVSTRRGLPALGWTNLVRTSGVALDDARRKWRLWNAIANGPDEKMMRRLARGDYGPGDE